MEDRFDLAQNWFKKADSDLKNVELIFQVVASDKPFDTVCFHCQQAVEKYLKGFLIYLEVPFTKTHNIEVLIDLVSQRYPEIEKYEFAISLTGYSVENRYPDDFIEVSEYDAQEAYRIALSVKDFILIKIQALYQKG